MAAFVYHLCAPDFRGTTLLPLDNLREALPEIYERERVKYDRRESVLEFVMTCRGWDPRSFPAPSLRSS